MYFSYDIIDQRAKQSPDDTAVKWHSEDGYILEISNADLHHHSDVTAYYLRRMGINKESVVALYGLENIFEFVTVLTALNKLCAIPMFDLQQKPIERCNQMQAYAIIAESKSAIINTINNNIDKFNTLEIKISVGFPYPQNWFDLHTGTRLASIFKPAYNLPKQYTSLIVYDDKPILYDETYPFTTDRGCLWDKFFHAMRTNSIFEF